VRKRLRVSPARSGGQSAIGKNFAAPRWTRTAHPAEEGRLAGQETPETWCDQPSPRGTDKSAASLQSPATTKAPAGGAGLAWMWPADEVVEKLPASPPPQHRSAQPASSAPFLLATWFSSEGELRTSAAVAQLGISQTGRSMMRALAILTVLPLVLTAPAFGQNAQQQPTSPNSGAGIAGQPGSKSGPAAKSPSATTGSGVGESRNQDAAKVPGLPGSKSGPAVKPPSSSDPAPK
jgi:hypothetical protein